MTQPEQIIKKEETCRSRDKITKTVKLVCLCDKCGESFELVLSKDQVKMLLKSFKMPYSEAQTYMDGVMIDRSPGSLTPSG